MWSWVSRSPVKALIISKEGQGQPAAAAHGRSLSYDYRVCAGHGGLIIGMRWQESVCGCVCVWALDSDHRVCVRLAEKIAGTAMLKKTTTGGRCGAKKYKMRDAERTETGSDRDAKWQDCITKRQRSGGEEEPTTRSKKKKETARRRQQG